MIKYKFSNNLDLEFSKALKKRVNHYFASTNIDRRSDSKMHSKTLLAFFSYLLIYLVILFAGINQLWILFILWAMLGLGQALIGMTVMHDTVHGAYSKNKLVNLLLELPILLIGVESKVWRIEHNILHHTYTNIEGVDQDIAPRYVFRFSNNQKKRWFHRYQHIYAVFFYSLLLVEWLTFKDFVKVHKYWRNGLIKTVREALFIAASILVKKSLFYLVFLVIPLYILTFKAYIIILMFLTMLSVAGVIMTIIFQTAHVIPGTSFNDQDEPLIDQNWHVYQMQTTANFASDNRIVTYLLGGLNFQIEHHLFPFVCHVHYPKIAPIVRQTAAEFNIPYHYNETIWDAASGHFKLLRYLGRNSDGHCRVQ